MNVSFVSSTTCYHKRMDPVLEKLSPQQKISALKVGLAVVASTNEGSIRSNDPDIITLVQGLYGSFSDESQFPEVLMKRVQQAIQMTEPESNSLLKEFSIEEQSAFKVLLGDIYHDEVVRQVIAGALLQEGGFVPPKGAATEKPKAKPALQQHSLVEITDVAAVREDNDECFNLFLANSEEEARHLPPQRMRANFDTWINAGLCPTEGMTGIVMKTKESPEGTLYYVAIEDFMVIPMLDFGIDVIDEGTFTRYRQNNKFHSYDPEGTRCRSLEASPRIVKDKVYRKTDPGKVILNVVTHILRRYENGVLVSDAYNDRLVILEYSDHGRRLDLTVHMSMQTKHAQMVKDDGSVLYYKDIDVPWARYEVETGPDNETVRVSIFTGPTEYQYHI